ncbi:MAG: hypothetical protein U9M94_00895, partial [Patescibacteria group bacterium]|nr:hypothetical protein [Patescibacteria group bacterium]
FILIIAPIIKIPSSDEGIITRNLKSIREGQISLISLYNLDLLLRKFQMDYIIKKTLDNKITGEQKFKITVKFSPEFLKRIRNTEDRINIEEIIKSIQIKAEDAVKKENFHKPIEMLRLNYNIKGEVTVSYLT